MVGVLCSEDWIGGYCRWCYGSNHHHTMTDVVAVQVANVVFKNMKSVVGPGFLTMFAVPPYQLLVGSHYFDLDPKI